MALRRFCLALDLKPDEMLIKEYEDHHRQVWPEVLDSIKTAGIEALEIYRFSNRLFMIMEVNESFSFENKQQLDEANPKVQEWEQLMWKYQQSVPTANKNEKWVLMDKIFSL
jgi:L-rhamnose mutarotase